VVRLDGRSIVLLGDSEPGKSTLTLAALTLGGEVLSDDWILLRQRDGQPVATSLRTDMLLRPSDATQALINRGPGHYASRAAHDQKIWLKRPSSYPRLNELPCDALVHLEACGERPATTRLNSLSPVQAYAHLLEGTSAVLFSSIFNDEAASLHRLSLSLVQKPAFSTTTGYDLIEDPEAVWRSILDAVNAARATEE
jgi:hypothetical protein